MFFCNLSEGLTNTLLTFLSNAIFPLSKERSFFNCFSSKERTMIFFVFQQYLKVFLYSFRRVFSSGPKTIRCFFFLFAVLIRVLRVLRVLRVISVINVISVIRVLRILRVLDVICVIRVLDVICVIRVIGVYVLYV